MSVQSLAKVAGSADRAYLPAWMPAAVPRTMTRVTGTRSMANFLEGAEVDQQSAPVPDAGQIVLGGAADGREVVS